jgi:hypothetical protein
MRVAQEDVYRDRSLGWLCTSAGVVGVLHWMASGAADGRGHGKRFSKGTVLPECTGTWS